jgi:hypothetical protein
VSGGGRGEDAWLCEALKEVADGEGGASGLGEAAGGGGRASARGECCALGYNTTRNVGFSSCLLSTQQNKTDNTTRNSAKLGDAVGRGRHALRGARRGRGGRGGGGELLVPLAATRVGPPGVARLRHQALHRRPLQVHRRCAQTCPSLCFTRPSLCFPDDARLSHGRPGPPPPDRPLPLDARPDTAACPLGRCHPKPTLPAAATTPAPPIPQAGSSPSPATWTR